MSRCPKCLDVPTMWVAHPVKDMLRCSACWEWSTANEVARFQYAHDTKLAK